MRTLKKSKYILVFFLLLIFITGIATGYYITSFSFVAIAYLIYEILGSDHINYDVSKDHDYTFSKSHISKYNIQNNTIIISEEHLKNGLTIFLEITCKSNFTGYLLDPYIEIKCGEKSVRQYFERGFQGKRYLNISHLPLSTTHKITLFPKHCHLQNNNCNFISMRNPDLHSKKVLIIAPHSDDAEIAAYALYSNHNSMIVTITGGESESSPHLVAMAGNNKSASELKGRLRAWDSVAIPIWAGLNADRVINLGYSDNSLEKLYLNQTEHFPTETKKIFRQFNTIKLRSDQEATASWQSLIQDLSEIIAHFKPDVIVTPHPDIDAHNDHRFSTKAIKEAIFPFKSTDLVFLYYINHLSNTDRWPFGPHGSLVAPPPGIRQVEGFYSFPVAPSEQVNKACSLEMMHDLRTEPKLKHRLRYWLQKKIINRPIHPMGKDPYFRKSIRRNELFITETIK